MDASKHGNHRARLRNTIASMLAACAAGSSLNLPAADNASSLAAHYTQGTFRIPFHVGPGGRCPESLDLLVSRDSGRTWQVHQSAAPAESAFQVTQADEGEFLVKVQARDSRAAAVSRSMMKLIVDRTAPELGLTCDWQPDTGLSIDCTLEDRCLDSKSIKLELRTNRQPQPVLLQPGMIAQQGAAYHLQTIIPLGVCESFEVRLTACDLAGNRQICAERFRHPQASEDSELLAEYGENPVATEAQVASDALQIEPSDWSTVTLAAPVSKPPMHLTGYSKTVDTSPRPASTPIELTPPIEPTPPVSRPTVTSDSLELTAPEVAPAVSSVNVPRVESQSRRLTLGYHFDERAASSSMSVELWCSLDQGQSWSYWGNDLDCQSPCRVEVEKEGEYHFRIVSLHGPQDQVLRPSAGDAADIVVVVLPEKPKPAPPVRLQPVTR